MDQRTNACTPPRSPEITYPPIQSSMDYTGVYRAWIAVKHSMTTLKNRPMPPPLPPPAPVQARPGWPTVQPQPNRRQLRMSGNGLA
ncbi:hypothetical protein C0995_011189 [Termitomyces sp. Mi166|nr:hypothetical protein C0995_011189 [Termitomyces sp. Mi166\